MQEELEGEGERERERKREREKERERERKGKQTITTNLPKIVLSQRVMGGIQIEKGNVMEKERKQNLHLSI